MITLNSTLVLGACNDQDLSVLARKAGDIAGNFGPKKEIFSTSAFPSNKPQLVYEIRKAIEEIQYELKSHQRSGNTQNRSRFAQVHECVLVLPHFSEESQICREPCKYFDEFNKSKNYIGHRRMAKSTIIHL